MHRAWRSGAARLLEHRFAPALFAATGERAPGSDGAAAPRTGRSEPRSSGPTSGVGRRRMDVATAQVGLVGGAMGGPACRSDLFSLGLRARRRRSALVRARNVARRERFFDRRSGADRDGPSRPRRDNQRKRGDREHWYCDSEASGQVTSVEARDTRVWGDKHRSRSDRAGGAAEMEDGTD